MLIKPSGSRHYYFLISQVEQLFSRNLSNLFKVQPLGSDKQHQVADLLKVVFLLLKGGLNI